MAEGCEGEPGAGGGAAGEGVEVGRMCLARDITRSGTRETDDLLGLLSGSPDPRRGHSSAAGVWRGRW